MVRQSGNNLINNKSWAQIVTNSGVQKIQQNKSQNKKAQAKPQKKQQTQVQKPKNQPQLNQVKQYLDKSKSSITQIRKYVVTTQYPLSISSAELKALQQEFQGLCNLFNANNYIGKSAQKKAWIQTNGRCVISVASCYSLKHKPVPNLVRPQQKRAMSGGLKFIPRQNKNMKKKNQSKFGENRQSSWGAEKAWGKNQPKQIREPPKDQLRKQKQMMKKQQQQEQMEKIQQRHKRQMELLQRVQLKQQELLLKKQTEQRKKLLQYQKQQKLRLQQANPLVQTQASAPAPVRSVRMVNQKSLNKQAKPLRRRLEAVRKQNQLVESDSFTYTLNQLCDAFNYFSKKSYSGDRAWKYNKFLGGYFSTASYFAERNAPFVPSSRPRVTVTNGLPVYTFSVKPTTKNVIKPYNSNLQGVRTEGNGKFFEHWNMGSIWTHYYSKPKARI